MSQPVTATIRMYRLDDELGDCFLLNFADSGTAVRVLLDCGSFTNSTRARTRLLRIAGDIEAELQGSGLDVVIGTHQHNDHVSGFLHCEPVFRRIGIDQVWLSWLDDPNDRQAQAIGRDYNNLRNNLAAARGALSALARRNRPAVVRTLAVMNDVLGFFGARTTNTPPTTPADAVKILEDIGTQRPRYLEPGRTFDLPGLPADTVRVHVLGPPRNEKLLYRKDPRSGESYDHTLTAVSAMVTKFLAAAGQARTARDEAHYPFNEQYKRRSPKAGSKALADVGRAYHRRAADWRRIDDAWIQQGERLALWLDGYTNNSSLVLAFELVRSAKVLLFVADAQTGNWLSWDDVRWQSPGVTTDDLLARTVFYKVGHHASHNATLIAQFEKMNHPDLAALIPVHKKDSNITKPNGWKMPARNLFERIVEKTDHRVLQMDGVNPPTCNPESNPAKAAWRRAGVTPKLTARFVELRIQG